MMDGGMVKGDPESAKRRGEGKNQGGRPIAGQKVRSYAARPSSEMSKRSDFGRQQRRQGRGSERACRQKGMNRLDDGCGDGPMVGYVVVG